MRQNTARYQQFVNEASEMGSIVYHDERGSNFSEVVFNGRVKSITGIRTSQALSNDTWQRLSDLTSRKLEVCELYHDAPVGDLRALNRYFSDIDYLAIQGELTSQHFLALGSVGVRCLRITFSPENTLGKLDCGTVSNLTRGSLEHLEVFWGRIDRCAMKAIGANTSLSYLEFVSCDFVAKDIALLSGHPRIETLDLTDCPITDDIEAVVSKLPSLRVLGLTDTRVTKDCITRIEAKYPLLLVRY